MTNVKTITESLRTAVESGDLGGISNGVEALEGLLGEDDGCIVKIPLYLEQKDALRFVMTHDGYFHSAWEVGEGIVVVVEYVPVNYPALAFATFESIAAYEEAVKKVPWIVDEDDEDDEDDGDQSDHLATPEFLQALRKMA